MCGQEEFDTRKIKDSMLSQCLEEVGSLSSEDQHILAVLVDSFIKRRKCEKLMQA